MTKIEVYYLIDLFVFLQLALVLTYRQHISRFMREWEMDPHRRPYIIWVGFYGVYHIGHITLDWELITSLVERWCPKTHISPTYWDLDHYFNLQDVAIMSRPKTYFKGMTVISHLKPKGSKWKRHKLHLVIGNFQLPNSCSE